MESAFLTFEEAGAMLGGTERPFSRDTIEKLIDARRLRDNGMKRKLRRVLRSSVIALIAAIERGDDQCHVSEKQAMVMVPSIRTRRPAVGVLSFPTVKEGRLSDAPLRARKRKR